MGDAVEIMRISRRSLSRWMVGPKGTRWAGYPTPFPILDRVVRNLRSSRCDPLESQSDSWLGAVACGQPPDELLEALSRRSFGLIEVPGVRNLSAMFPGRQDGWADVRQAALRAGVRAGPLRRLWQDAYYPWQWRALDNLVNMVPTYHCLDGFSSRWLIAVLRWQPVLPMDRVPPSALACLAGR